MVDQPKPGTEIAKAFEQVPSELHVGIALTTDPATTQRLFERFCLALGEVTGIAVVPRSLWSYQHLLDELEGGKLDIVWLPPILALRAAASDLVVPIALPVRNGVSSYYTALFSRGDSGIRTVADLKGLRAAWVDPQSAAGYLIIRAHLELQGVDLAEAFASDSFVGTHDGVAQAVLRGEADVGASYTNFEPGAARDGVAGWGKAKVTIITHAGPVPADVVAADKRLNSLVVRMLQSALVDVKNAQLRQAARALLAAEGFVVPKPEHLAPLTELLSHLNEAPNKPASIFPPPA